MTRGLLLSIFAGLAPGALAQSITFTPVDLASAPYNGSTRVAGISGDGLRVAGEATTPTNTFVRAVAWNADGNVAIEVPVPIPGEVSFGVALSDNGSLFFGTRVLPFGPTTIERPFRFDATTGTYVVLATALGATSTDIELRDVDSSGTFALLSRMDPSTGLQDAVRFNVLTNAFSVLGASMRDGQAISGDGSVAVGLQPDSRGWRVKLGVPAADQDTCQFSNNLLCQTQLGTELPRNADAQAVSPDGAWIGGGALVGNGYGNGFDVPYATDGTSLFAADIQGCGYGGGATLDISDSTIAGGPVVVGRFGCNNQPQAFFWRQADGLVYVQSYLSDAGIDMSNWFLTETTGVSNDGRTITGNGFFEGQVRSWIATLGDGTVACDSIDFNNNGVFPEDQDVIDFFDVLAGGSPATCDPTLGCQDIDFNNNGVFPEDQDVIDFFNVLAGGACPA